MDTDIRDQIDRSFGDGPAYVDDGRLLDDGRRALRRRRGLPVVAAVAVVVVAGVAWASLGRSSSTTGQDPLAPPSSSAAPQPQPGFEYRPASDPDLDGQDAAIADDGTVLVRQGVEVDQLIENPFEVDPPKHSAALAYHGGSGETWALLLYDRTSGGGWFEPARQSFPDLEQWVSDQIAMQRGEPTLALVAFGPDGELVPEAGVEILQQRADVDMGPTFAGPGDPTAVAEVRWQGERWYVLARDLPGGPPEYFPTAASVSRPTLDGFLAYARASYDSGTGLR
jgi:hypothetical protein